MNCLYMSFTGDVNATGEYLLLAGQVDSVSKIMDWQSSRPVSSIILYALTQE